MPPFAAEPLSAEFWTDFLGKWGAGVLIFLCTSVLSFVVGRLVGRRRARREWLEKRFLGRINVGVNTFADGCLKIRSLTERSPEEVFLNPVAVEKVQAAARRTTVEDPLLPLEADDCWYLLNFVLSSFSDRFSQGVIRYDAGQPVHALVYRLFLTCEKVGEDRIHKVRALLVREELLRDFPYHDAMPKLEDPSHADRIVTHRRAARLFPTHPHYFMRVELYV
jgi:hypothetical protein